MENPGFLHTKHDFKSWKLFPYLLGSNTFSQIMRIYICLDFNLVKTLEIYACLYMPLITAFNKSDSTPMIDPMLLFSLIHIHRDPVLALTVTVCETQKSANLVPDCKSKVDS